MKTVQALTACTNPQKVSLYGMHRDALLPPRVFVTAEIAQCGAQAMRAMCKNDSHHPPCSFGWESKGSAADCEAISNIRWMFEKADDGRPCERQLTARPGIGGRRTRKGPRCGAFQHPGDDYAGFRADSTQPFAVDPSPSPASPPRGLCTVRGDFIFFKQIIAHLRRLW